MHDSPQPHPEEQALAAPLPHLRLPPGRLRAPPAPPAHARQHRIGLLRLGLQLLRHLLAQGRLWARLWLAPQPWPQPPPGLAVIIPGQGDLTYAGYLPLSAA